MTRIVLAFVAFYSVLATGAGAAQAPADDDGPADLVIRNVYLLGRQRTAEDVLVNIVIVDGRLRVVTESDVPPDTAGMNVDAEEGFLMGTLIMGSPPRLVILDQDPRDDFDTLLDTATHVRFAMKDGVVVLNELPTAVVDDVEAPEVRGWRAYTPPPIAVPLRYYDGRKWNRFDSRYVSGLVNGALVLDRLEWLSQDSGSESQMGDLTPTEGGEIRALRLGVVGRLKFENPWIYTVYAATNTFDKGFDSTTTDDLVWFDYRLDIPLSETLNLSVGKQREPISMERLMPLTFFPWQERSAVNDTLLQARNFGVVVNGTGSGGRWTWAGSVFKNWIDADTSFDDTPTQVIGRATWLPFVSEDGSHLLHLGLGLRHSSAAETNRYRAEPEFNQAPAFLDTGVFAAESSLTSNVEAYWRRGPYWVGFEYTRSEFDAPQVGDPSFDGFHISATWALTGEMRTYRNVSGIFDPLPVAQSVTQGGWGTWEVGFRYSTLDLDDGGVNGGEMEIYSLGLNWWLTRWSQLAVNYRLIDLDRDGLAGRSSGLNVRLLLILD